MGERSQQQYFGVDHQYVLQLTLTENKNCSTITKFNEFLLIEETGNLLPTWRISFIAGKDLQNEWNENKHIPIVLSTSRNSPEKIESKLQIIHPTVTDLGNSLKLYTATGVYYAPAFTQTPFLTSVVPCAGTEVLQKVAAKYFTVDTTLMTISKETQPWIQSNTTDKKFLDYVVSHCYLPQSYVNIGITSSGKYRIVDPCKQSQQEAIYTLSMNKPQNSKELQIMTIPHFVSNTGVMNSIACYGMDTPIISQDSGLRTLHKPDVKFYFTNNDAAKAKNIERKTLQPVKCSMSNDPKSYMGKANYDYGCALLDMETCQVSVISTFFPIKIWDLVNLQCPGVNGNELDANYSGKYFVTKISRTIVNDMFYTHLLLNRDAHNRSF